MKAALTKPKGTDEEEGGREREVLSICRELSS